MFQSGLWVFLSFTRDEINGVMTYFTYNLNSGSPLSTTPAIANQSAIGAYSLLPSTVVQWGGADRTYSYCDCTMQYVRFYVNYAPNTQDQMINLALMNPQSKSLFLFPFVLTSFYI